MLKLLQARLGVQLGDARRNRHPIPLPLARVVWCVKYAVDGNLLEPRVLHVDHAMRGHHSAGGEVVSITAPSAGCTRVPDEAASRESFLFHCLGQDLHRRPSSPRVVSKQVEHSWQRDLEWHLGGSGNQVHASCIQR